MARLDKDGLQEYTNQLATKLLSKDPKPATENPKMDGTVAVGSSARYAREDHVHPTDTSRASASDLSSVEGRVDDLETAVGTGSVDQRIVDAINALDSSISAESNKAIASVTITDGKISAHTKATIPTKTSELTNDSTYQTASDVASAVANKVDKVTGKGLSTNDYTTAEKNKLSGIASGAEVNVQANWNESDSSSDAFIQNKPSIPSKVSDLTNDSGYQTASDVATAISEKVDKETGKGLSSNDYTTAEKNKLAGIASGAEVNVQSDWNESSSSSDAFIKNKPSIPQASSATPKMDGTATVGTETKWAHGDHIHPTDTSRASASDLTAVSGRVTTLETDVGTGSVDTRISNAIGALDSSISAETNKAIASVTITNGKISAHTKTAIPTKVSDLTNDSGYQTSSDVATAIANKVDKVSGKGLSTNDYTTTEKNKLAGIASGAEVNVQADWNEATSTSDAFIKNKPSIPTKVSDLTNDSGFQTASDVSSAIANKVDKETGKGLSTNDYTTTEKNKLSGIASGAEVNVQANWNETNTSSDAYIQNKPTTMPPSAHNHSQIITEGDNRSVATTPNDYTNNFKFKGLKYSNKIGSPSSDTYSYLLGLRGWSDNSGGNAHELAFNDSGIFARRGATTSWGSWEKLLTSENLTAGTGLSKSGTTLNHSNSVTAGTAGTSSATSSTNGTLAVPYVTYDAQGHITGSGTHTHTLTSFPEESVAWGGVNIIGNVSPVGASLSSEHSANRIAFLNPAAISIEYTQDGGTTWTDSGYTNAERMWLCTGNQSVAVGQSKAGYSGSTHLTPNYWTRITLTGQNGTKGYVYTAPRKLLVNISTALGLVCLIEYKNGTSGATWNRFGEYTVSGWSGWNDIPLILSTFGGASSQTSNNWYLRFTFKVTNERTDQYQGYASVLALRLFGATDWGSASSQNGKGPLSATGHLYSYDAAANATFPAQVTATQFNGALNGNATTASNVTSNGAAGGNVSRHVWFSDSATETKRAHDDNFKYNASTNTVTANISGNAATATRALNASNATPLANGTASAGTSTDFARADHVHPESQSGSSDTLILKPGDWTTITYQGKTLDAVELDDIDAITFYSKMNNGPLISLNWGYQGGQMANAFTECHWNPDTNVWDCTVNCEVGAYKGIIKEGQDLKLYFAYLEPPMEFPHLNVIVTHYTNNNLEYVEIEFYNALWDSLTLGDTIDYCYRHKHVLLISDYGFVGEIHIIETGEEDSLCFSIMASEDESLLYKVVFIKNISSITLSDTSLDVSTYAYKINMTPVRGLQ